MERFFVNEKVTNENFFFVLLHEIGLCNKSFRALCDLQDKLTSFM